MPRLPRIEFEGAVYHVMARGNHRGKIVFHDEDCRIFIKTFEDAIEKTGWEVYCRVLMSNHYHLVFRTPEPNLVAGMTWFQQTFTQRINARNRLRGHLFAGRYKSILVENEEIAGSNYRSDYLTNLIQYVHLNPGRAGFIDGMEKTILDYQWSSLAQWYAVAPSKRNERSKVTEGLDMLGFRDTVAGRRRYVLELDDTIRSESGEDPGVELPENQSLQSTLERGWYWGSQIFREQLLDRFGKIIDRKVENAGEGMTQLARDHCEKRGAEILEFAKQHFEMSDKQLQQTIRGDLRRAAIATVLSEQTTLSRKRIAEMLKMKSAGNVSQQIIRFRKTDSKALNRRIRAFLKTQN
ncbi:MAG: transposase [Verrucomicrobiales bacterium]|nr:transposase [Verrucomicrobiales bacterium]